MVHLDGIMFTSEDSVKVALTLVIHKVVQRLLPFGRAIRLHEIR